MRNLADITADNNDDIAIAHVRGQLDLSNVDEVYEALEAVVGASESALVLDLTDVTYLDSAGVRLLFRLKASLAVGGKRVRAIVPEGAVIRRVLLLADVPQAVPLDASLEDALAELRDLA